MFYFCFMPSVYKIGSKGKFSSVSEVVKKDKKVENVGSRSKRRILSTKIVFYYSAML